MRAFWTLAIVAALALPIGAHTQPLTTLATTTIAQASSTSVELEFSWEGLDVDGNAATIVQAQVAVAPVGVDLNAAGATATASELHQVADIERNPPDPPQGITGRYVIPDVWPLLTQEAAQTKTLWLRLVNPDGVPSTWVALNWAPPRVAINLRITVDLSASTP